MESAPKINVMCPIGYTGYGYVSLNILRSLYNNDQQSNIGLYPIGNPSLENEEDVTFIKKYMDNILSLPYDTTCLKIWHQFDLINRLGRGKYISMPFFEVDILSKRDVVNLNFPDEIIVSCDWAKNILIQNNVTTDIKVIPLGVDTNIFDETLNNELSNRDKYIFCTIGKWEKRKAHDSIIECFNSAFELDDNVELWMLTHNSFLTPEEEKVWLNKVSSSKLKDKIKLFPRVKSQNDIAKIIAYSDCGVYISRGEGWNMELLETMAMNKPVIVSDYSAHTEYCTSDNSYLVDITDTEPAIDNKWFFGEANWAKISKTQIEQTIAHMRFLYSNNIRQNEAGLATAKKLSWDRTTEQILTCV